MGSKSTRNLSDISAVDSRINGALAKKPAAKLTRRSKLIEREMSKPSYVPLDFKLSTLRELLILELEADDGYKAKAVVSTLVKKAMDGDTYCLRLLLERVDGLMTKNISLNGSLAVGQVVTLVDTREFSAQLPIREGSIPSLEPTPTSPKLLQEGVKSEALEAAVEVLGNATPVSLVSSGVEEPEAQDGERPTLPYGSLPRPE